MRPDSLSVILRSASFIALFQAAGMALFLTMFGRPLEVAAVAIARIAKLSAIAAATLLLGQYVLEAARMADDMSGIVDPSLQMMAMHSARSVVLMVRLLGLLVIAMAVGRRNDVSLTFNVLGVGIIAASFMLIGHTVANPSRWALAPLLTIHVLIVAFWFGALVPLYIACSRESPVTAAQVTEAFSRVALWLVPGILLAGLLLGVGLIYHLADFRMGYGISLLAKFCGFVALMGLAALNKLRLGPAIARGDGKSLRNFRRSLALEFVVISVVLSITAAMTTFYSPET